MVGRQEEIRKCGARERRIEEEEREWKKRYSVASRDNERDSSSLGDEKRDGAKGGKRGWKAETTNLTFISEILGFAPRRTLSRGSRARDRVEEGGHVS